jgi:hypothetical protein
LPDSPRDSSVVSGDDSGSMWPSPTALFSLSLLTALTACRAEPTAPPTIQVVAPPAAPAQVSPPPSSESPLVMKLHDQGIVKFVNRIELPNTIYSKRGKFDVTLGTSYVVVKDIENGDQLAFPRERLLFVGRNDFE